MMKAIIQEWQKPGVRYRDLCSRMMDWIDQPGSLGELNGRLPADWRVQLKRDWPSSNLCQRRRGNSLVSYGGGATLWGVDPTDFGDSAYVLINAIQTETEAALTPSGLASALSPILDASFELPSIDSAGVQAIISVAQSSFEFWYDNDHEEIVAVETQTASELHACLQGEMENESYEVDDITWICQNSEWHMAGWRQARPGALHFRLAAYTTASLSGCLTGRQKLAVIVTGDVTGGLFGALGGIIFGPGAIAGKALYGAVSGSISSAIGVSLTTYFCNQN
jgi:hypothetical protein